LRCTPNLTAAMMTAPNPIFLGDADDPHTDQRPFCPSDFRDGVLSRLLALNAERHAEEVRLGVAPGMREKQRRTTRK
jgi:hypothetical protein